MMKFITSSSLLVLTIQTRHLTMSQLKKKTFNQVIFYVIKGRYVIFAIANIK